MTRRFRLHTDNLISINRHVIGGVGNEHKAVIETSKVKGKSVHLCCSHSFLFFQVSQMNSLPVVQEKKMTA